MVGSRCSLEISLVLSLSSVFLWVGLIFRQAFPRKSLIAPHFPGITLADGRKSLYLLSFSKRPRMKSHWLALGPVSAAEPISRARVMQYSDWPHWGRVFPLKLKVLTMLGMRGKWRGSLSLICTYICFLEKRATKVFTNMNPVSFCIALAQGRCHNRMNC